MPRENVEEFEKRQRLDAIVDELDEHAKGILEAQTCVRETLAEKIAP